MYHGGQKIVFVFLSLLVFAIPSFAQKSNAKVGPSIGAMAVFGTGKMGNSTDVLERSMLYTPISIFAGFNIKKIRLGLNYEYNLVGQSDDPTSYSNQNIGGKGNSIGARIGYYDGKQALDLIYRASEKYTLDKPTLSGAVAEYEGKSGFSVQYYRQIKKRIGFVIDYTNQEMKSSNGNSDDLKWNRIGLGLVFTNFAGSGGKGR